jgi:hypothetical protein
MIMNQLVLNLLPKNHLYEYEKYFRELALLSYVNAKLGVTGALAV